MKNNNKIINSQTTYAKRLKTERINISTDMFTNPTKLKTYSSILVKCKLDSSLSKFIQCLK